jgi:hypothetical protein
MYSRYVLDQHGHYEPGLNLHHVDSQHNEDSLFSGLRQLGAGIRKTDSPVATIVARVHRVCLHRGRDRVLATPE